MRHGVGVPSTGGVQQQQISPAVTSEMLLGILHWGEMALSGNC